MNTIIPYSEIFESKKAETSKLTKKGSPLFETCKEFDFNGKLTVEQLRMIDELVLTEDIGYLDLVAIKEGWDIEDISEEDYPEEMTFTEFLEREFYDLDVEGFAQCIVEDLGLEDLSEEELHEFCMVLNEDNFFGDYSQDEELNEFFKKMFKGIGKAFKSVGKAVGGAVKAVGKGIGNVAKAVGKGVSNAVKAISKISLKDIGKALKKALPVIAVVAAVALTCVGVPVGLAIVGKAIGGLAKGAKAVGLAAKAGKAAKLKASIGKAMAKVKGGVAKLKAKVGIKAKTKSALANKNKAWKKTLDIVKKGAEKVKDDLLERGPEALESPDNHRICGTMAATYHSATEYADKLEDVTKDFPSDPEVAAQVDAQVNQMGGYAGSEGEQDPGNG